MSDKDTLNVLLDPFVSLDFKMTAELTDKKHSVIFEERQVCNLGRIRYKTSLALANSWPVTDEFAASVCQLPAEYNQKAYMKFLEDYGTVHVNQMQILSVFHYYLTLKLAGGGFVEPPPLVFFGLKFSPLDQLPNAFAQLFLDYEDIF